MRLRHALTPILTLLAVLLALPAQAADKAKHEIKFASLAPEGSTWMNVMRELDTQVRDSTGGTVGFKVYAGGVQGDEPDVLRKIRFGQLHAAGFTGVGMGEILPAVRVLDLPMLFRSKDEVDYVLDRFTPWFDDAFREKGFVLLGWAEVGWVYFFANVPIHATEDLKGIKVWAWTGDPLPKSLLKEFGVTPVPLAVPEVLTGLQTGMIDAIYSPPLAALSLQWFTRVQYMNLTPLTNSMGAVLMSKRQYDRIPEKDRETLLRISRRKLRELTHLSREDNDQAIREMREAGIEMLGPLPADELEQYRQVGIKVQNELAGDLYPEHLLNDIRRALEDYREKQGE